MRGSLTEQDVAKIDSSPDELFYFIPRIGVYHVDDSFRAQLTQLYRLLVPAGGDVLDLCSQHDSHLPSDVEFNSLTVHGMNYVELLANGRATDRFTQNFNNSPLLESVSDESMDAVLMTVSIQYMERPVELFREVRRVLRPGGVFIVSYSNRMFFTKAVEIWRSQRSMLGLARVVQGYLQQAGFDNIRVANAVKLPKESSRAGVGLPFKLPEPPTGWLPNDPFAAAVGLKGSSESTALSTRKLELEGVAWLPLLGNQSIW